MGSEGKCDYGKKWLCRCTVILMTVILILSLVISYGDGNGANSIEMSGSCDSAVVEESYGLHLVKINQSGKWGDEKSGWTWMEVACVIIGFKLILSLLLLDKK